jgi:hypothetical protein
VSTALRLVVCVRWRPPAEDAEEVLSAGQEWGAFARPLADRATALGGRIVGWQPGGLSVDFAVDGLQDAVDFLLDEPLSPELSCGIAHGELTMLTGSSRMALCTGEVLGVVVKLADYARPGEVLVTPELVAATSDELITTGAPRARAGRAAVPALILDLATPLRSLVSSPVASAAPVPVPGHASPGLAPSSLPPSPPAAPESERVGDPARAPRVPEILQSPRTDAAAEPVAPTTAVRADEGAHEDVASEPHIEPIEVEAQSEPENEPIEVEAQSEPENEPVEVEAQSEPENEPVEVEAQSEPENEPLEATSAQDATLDAVEADAVEIEPLDDEADHEQIEPLEIEASSPEAPEPPRQPASVEPEAQMLPLPREAASRPPMPSTPPVTLRSDQVERLREAASLVQADSIFPASMAEALGRRDASSLDRMAASYRERNQHALAFRLDAIASLVRGHSSEALRELRSAQQRSLESSLSEQCRARLAYAVGLSAAGRQREAFIEALGALARAREAKDQRGERACVRFLAQVARVFDEPEAAARWQALSLPPA